MTKLGKVFEQTLPLIVGMVVIYFLWRHTIHLAAFYAGIVGVLILSGKDKKTELIIFCYGFLVGAAIEIAGTFIGYEKFPVRDIFEIPYWLPICWGYAFIAMKRIGLIISKNSPWSRAR